MKLKKRVLIIMFAAFVALAGCGRGDKNDSKEPATTVTPTAAVTEEPTATATPTSTPTPSSGPTPEPYTYNPHVYPAMLSADYGPEYRETFFKLCDALRAGKDTFECPNEDVYKWCTDIVTLNHLSPYACTRVTPESPDGTASFADGIGRIYYKIDPAEFVKGQQEFEQMVTDILAASGVNHDYSDFEKSFALYNYIVSNYDFDYEGEKHTEGAVYHTFVTKKGICCDYGAMYAYLLLQVGIDAVEVQTFGDNYHAWTIANIDGDNVHLDPTWGLKEDKTRRAFKLEYFMMNDDDRASHGYPADKLQAPLTPYFFASQSHYDYTVKAVTFSFPADTYFTGCNFEKNEVYYREGVEETGAPDLIMFYCESKD